MVAQARRGFSAAQVVVRGHDLYRTTAAIAAWVARAARRARRTVRSACARRASCFAPEPALRELADAQPGSSIEPSFALP